MEKATGTHSQDEKTDETCSRGEMKWGVSKNGNQWGKNSNESVLCGGGGGGVVFIGPAVRKQMVIVILFFENPYSQPLRQSRHLTLSLSIKTLS